MKIISLNCNHCGAPLDAPAKAKFLTCSFCDSRLAIQRTGTSYSTALLEEIHETTQSLARDVAEVKRRSDLEQLDRAWKMKQANYLVSGKNGRTSIPTKTGAVISGAIGGAFGLIWTILASGITRGRSSVALPFVLFGLLFTGLAVFGAIRSYGKAEAYERAQAKYRKARRKQMNG